LDERRFFQLQRGQENVSAFGRQASFYDAGMIEIHVRLTGS
jgi:hypothetical protein